MNNIRPKSLEVSISVLFKVKDIMDWFFGFNELLNIDFYLKRNESPSMYVHNKTSKAIIICHGYHKDRQTINGHPKCFLQ